MSTTPKFDPSICQSPQVLQTYKNTCNGDSKCIERMKEFCNSQLYTQHDFNTQNHLLECFSTKCKNKNDQCLDSCAAEIINQIKYS